MRKNFLGVMLASRSAMDEIKHGVQPRQKAEMEPQEGVMVFLLLFISRETVSRFSRHCQALQVTRSW